MSTLRYTALLATGAPAAPGTTTTTTSTSTTTTSTTTTALTEDWSFGAANPLVRGYLDYELVMALDPVDQSIYAFWTRQSASTYHIYWDKEMADFDLTPYLLRGEDISIARSIDGRAARLEFGLSHGHIFDPHNIKSLWRIYLYKGRVLKIEFGEDIAGTEYWQNMGKFFVTELSLAGYERGQYPTAHMVGEDLSSIFQQMEIVATEHYEAAAEEVLSDILQDHGGLEPADIDIPSFDASEELFHQWVDTSLWDIVLEICHRFGYYPRFDVDAKITARKISDVNPTDHTYSDQTKMIRFSPDDSFSDYINRIMVEGQERTWTEVLYAEERVASLNGSVGWWGHSKQYKVWYSEDKSRTCRNPRLEIVESATSIAFSLAGRVTESIVEVDPDDKYCIIEVNAPNLIPELLAAIAAFIGARNVGDYETEHITIPFGRVTESVALMVIINILASIGNFQYAIWAKPLGKVRRSIKGEANDEELQNRLGKVVEKKLDDPLCYTISQCTQVAAQELLVAQLQRKRVRFSKIADFRDEDGDTIQLNHPYSDEPVKVFITDLKRRLKIPESPGGDGYIMDEIEGWVL